MEKVRVTRENITITEKNALKFQGGKKKVSKEFFSAFGQKKLPGMCLTVVRIVGFVVQHKFIIDKVERVGSSLEGIGNHLVDKFRW